MSAAGSLLLEQPHRRLNALTGEWVFVSPQRLMRPWQGARDEPGGKVRPAYDPACYLCPRNRRANGERNPDYASTYVFDNDFPAFLDRGGASAPPPGESAEGPLRTPGSSLLTAHNQSGVCRVICYSPRHDLTLADMSEGEVAGVIRLWMEQAADLEGRWTWVQIFENKGEQMGCSNPHPHGQIWAGDFIPTEVARELQCQDRWLAQHQSSLLLDYARLEEEEGGRVVVQNEHWLALVPWWAAWPYETLILPRSAIASLTQLSAAQQASLAQLLGRLLGSYDRLFAAPFPYSLGWHGAPRSGGARHGAEGRQLHAHVYSSLLRSASVRKFMVGYELLAEVQRDLTPEEAAARLRAVSRTA